MATSLVVAGHHCGPALGTHQYSFPLQVELIRVEKASRLLRCSPPARKKVRFARDHLVQVTVSNDQDANKWYSSQELHEIRHEAKTQSQRLRSASISSPESCEVTMAYRKTSFMLDGNMEPLLNLPTSTPEQDLRAWCSVEDGRRGLERFGSRDYSHMRKQDLRYVRRLVLAEYKRQRDNNCFDDEYLSMLSRQATRRSRTFALFLGEADALVAGTAHPAPPIRRTPPRKRSKQVRIVG